MHARLMGLLIFIAGVMGAPEAAAEDGPCPPPLESFKGYWGGGLVRVRETMAGVPIVVMTRFSYKEIRDSPCAAGVPLLPPGVGEANISIGVPIFDNRRGGWLLQMAAKGQGSQRPGTPVAGLITGAPTTAGHLNIWETAVPLIQLTGVMSAAITPQAGEFPMSIAWLGGARVYPLHGKNTQANLGLMVGGSNHDVNVIPSLSFRVSDLPVWDHKIAFGIETRSPINLSPGPRSVSWRFWGAVTIAIDQVQDPKEDRSSAKKMARQTFDLVRSPAEAAPPVQTTWEMTL